MRRVTVPKRTGNDIMESESTEKRKSELKTGRERFLAHVIEHALQVGRRSPEDFVRHFPPSEIMEGLKDRPSLRAKILVPTVGTKHKVALKKSWQSAADDLAISLAERETEAAMVVELFDPDDRVTYLEATKLWQFITEGAFWKSDIKGKSSKVAQQHVAFMLNQALEDKLITHQDVVEGISVGELALRLSKEALGKIIEEALRQGKTGSAFTETNLLSAMPPEVLVEFVPLSHIWDTVIQTRIAEQHGYVQANDGDAAGDNGVSAMSPDANGGEDPDRWTDAPPSGDIDELVEAIGEDDLTDADFDDEGVIQAS